ncbi:MAG: cadherin repeat domain-containing protein, partial [Gammaproteobacteria bacterium]|nr:cadherin repeat domain-containing protein [Gammaproteobacteria bacterium]
MNENAVSGTAVGNLTTTRGTVGYAFSLVDGVDDNGFFRISGNTLLLNVSPDFESKGSYAIVVRNSDQGGAWTSTPLAVTVIDINESPTDIALSPAAI